MAEKVGWAGGRGQGATPPARITTAALMPERPPAREDHRHAVLVGRGDDFGIPDTEPPGWTMARDARFGGLIHAVAEREIRVGPHAPRPACRRPACAGLVHGEERRVDARHLPRADADRRARPWRSRSRWTSRSPRPATRTRDRPTRPGRLPLGSRRASDDRPASAGGRSCTSRPPRTRLKSSAPRRHSALPTSTRRFFLRPSISSALSVNAGATTHSTNRLRHRLRGRIVDRHRERDHRSERRHRIACERLPVRLERASRRSRARTASCA